jgi:hypothetical protein
LTAGCCCWLVLLLQQQLLACCYLHRYQKQMLAQLPQQQALDDT